MSAGMVIFIISGLRWENRWYNWIPVQVAFSDWMHRIDMVNVFNCTLLFLWDAGLIPGVYKVTVQLFTFFLQYSVFIVKILCTNASLCSFFSKGIFKEYFFLTFHISLQSSRMLDKTLFDISCDSAEPDFDADYWQSSHLNLQQVAAQKVYWLWWFDVDLCITATLDLSFRRTADCVCPVGLPLTIIFIIS